LRNDHVEHFADIFTDQTQITTAIGAAGTRVKFAALARGRI
jgi:hypothetical protein